MLKQIKIQNLAIIEDVVIDFNTNFTVLTGATGAGKSLVIDSLKLIFGKRADSDYIRYQEDEAVIEAVFVNLNQKAKKYLASLMISHDKLVIKRWISRKDKNKILINNKAVSLFELRELSYLLGDIHEQQDTARLLDPKTALTMIDEFGNTKDLVNQYVILRHDYLDKKAKLEKALKQEKETLKQLDELKYQFEELKKAKLVSGELIDLSVKITTLSHQKEITEKLETAYEALYKIEEENTVFLAKKALEKIKTYREEYNKLFQRLEDSYYELSDVKTELHNLLEQIKDASIFQLDELKERYYFLKDLEKKYDKSVEDLIDYYDFLEEEILKFEDYDDYLKKIKAQVDKAYEKAYKQGLTLRKKRMETALEIEKDFVVSLKRLAIDYVLFKVEFLENMENSLYEDGIDEIIFMISLNQGEPLKPFYKVASGGELSRSMLALKLLYGKIHDLDLMVFDEIDLGISGDAASKVAEELYNLSNIRQVIAITHLPQVAALADTFYNIEKQLEDGRTITLIKDLDENQRVYQIAYMLSGKNITQGAIMHAKSLLKNKKSP